MALEKDLVAWTFAQFSSEEVVEADFVEGGRGGVGGKVAANACGLFIRPQHHRHGVPSDQCTNSVLDFWVTGIRRFSVGIDRVEIRRRDSGRETNIKGSAAIEQTQKEIARSSGSIGVNGSVEGIEPAIGSTRVDIYQLLHHAFKGRPLICLGGVEVLVLLRASQRSTTLSSRECL